MRSSIGSLASLALPLVLAATACGGTEAVPDLLARTQQPIQGGTAAGTKYPFVVGMISRVGNGAGTCTGTLIAPNLVLTARHCLSDVNSENIDCRTTEFTNTSRATDMAVTFETVMRFDDFERDFVGVAKVIVPTEDAMCGHDVALLILTENVPESVATPATPMIWNKITDDTGVTEVTAIGYGTTDGESGSGTRRIRENIPVLCAFGHPRAAYDCNNQGQDVSFLITEADVAVGTGVCQGDSGSSAFEQEAFDRGEFHSVGILSRGPAGGCDLGVYTRVDALKDIILDAAAQAADLGGYPAPAWTVEPTANPTPGASSSGNGGAVEVGAACSEDVECGDTLVCVEGACAEAAAPAEEAAPKKRTTTTTTTGCSVAADPTKPIPWRSGSSVAFLALGVGLLLRRRSSR